MLSMVDRLDVFSNGKKVGTLAITKDGSNRIAFQYDKEWQKTGFSLNPIKLPLSDELFIADSPYFDGLFGIFADSLPDSYGELLLDRYLKQKNIDINGLSPLDRLAYVGSSGMGSLEYVPDFSNSINNENIDFDEIQKECDALFEHKDVKNIDSLYCLGGSSGGARPKSLIKLDGEDYIVKFSARFDPKNISELEYKYMSLAKLAGIDIPEIRLVRTNSNRQYFAIKRFDRENGKKIHLVSVAGLLECNFRGPSLDYNDLIKLTRVLTQNKDDVLEMYRRMVFNVLIDNQDDHAKNFAFIYDEDENNYRLSPAYDLTPTKVYYGEHITSVNGKGKDISIEDMLNVAKNNKIKIETAIKIIDEVKNIIDNN